MSSSTPPEKASSNFSLPYWSTAYFLSVAVLYLWGYWAPFKINILEYVGLSDLVKTAAYPIASVFIFMAVGAVAGELMFPEGFIPPGGGRNTKVGRFLRRNLSNLTVIYAAITALIYLFGTSEKWRILPVLVAIPTSLALKSAGILEDKIRHERVRGVALFLIATLPLLAYGLGVLKADDVLTGKSYLYVVSKLESVTTSTYGMTSMRLRYIGRAGDHYFLYSPISKTVLVVPQSEAKVLELASSQTEGTSATVPSLPASAAAFAASAPSK